MKKITDFIVKKRKLIIVLFIIFSIISVILSNKVKINYDMTEYMPSNSETRIGLNIMNSEFKEEESSALNIMFKNLTEDEKNKIYQDLLNIEGVASVDYDKDSSRYNKDENTLYILNVNEPEDSQTAKNVYNFVNDNFKDYEFYTSGAIENRNKDILPMWIIALAVTICAVILIVMCESYIEPFLFLACIGIAVLLNNGTNIIFGTVSNITSSISAILQLALSMDYSIMLINRYKQEKEKYPDKVEAMKEALYKSFGSISSSSATTIVGLITLVFMSFTIGKDLGFVLAKGVLLSLLVIFTCLPALILMFDKLITKTKKKSPNINLKWLGNFAYKFRKIGFIALIVIFIASYILKGNLGILYTDSEVNKVGEVFPENNQMAIIYKSENESKVSEFLPNLEQTEKVDEVLAYGNTIGEPLKYNEFNSKLEDLSVDTKIEDYLLKILYFKYYNEQIQTTMTFDEFVNFTKNNVLNNEDFSSKIDENISSNIQRLEHFTGNDEMNKKRSYKEIASILEMDETDCYNLFIYYYADKVNINLTTKEFISFINNVVLKDNEYSKNISQDVRKNLNTISKFLNKETLNKNMSSKEMANLFEIDESKVKDLYLYYYSINGTTNKMTLNEFASFVMNDVYTNKNYSSMFNEQTIQSITLLKTMSDTNIINKQMSSSELSAMFGVNKEAVDGLLVLRAGMKDSGSTMSIAELVNFIIYLNDNTNYLNGIDLSSVILLKDFANNANNINTVKLNRAELAQVFNNVSNGLVDIVYTTAGLPDDYTMTSGEFLNLVIENFASNMDEQSLNKLKLLKSVIEDSLSNAPKKYTATQMANIIGVDKSNIYKIYALYDAYNGKSTSVSPYEFIKFIVENSTNQQISSNINAETLNKLKTAYKIMNSSNSNTSYTYGEIADFIGIDNAMAKKLYALYVSEHGGFKLSPVKFTEFILQNKNDSTLKNNIDSSTINSLKLVYEIMNSVLTGKKYSYTEISNMLNLNKDDVKLLYSLYSAKYINGNMQISLKEFVNFTLDNVVTNEKYSSKFDNDKITKLNAINGIMNAVVNQTKYNPEEIFGILSKLTDSINQDTIDILYIYYGSENYFNEDWVITIEQFINYVNDDILQDSRFNDFIDDETRNKVADAKDKIDSNKERLVGKKYSRIVLNTKFDLEGNETYEFLQKIYDNLDGVELYIVGDSPMAYEMSKSFESEFNKISILTMVAIFIVVAITFKSVGIPFILVLIIQCAVYMTMGILSLLGGEIYFIALLIVQSILMGATIDYAILYTSYYKESRATMNVKDSVINSYNKSINTILTSSSILIIATFLVGKFATAIVSKICITLAQGVLCSTILILLILPEVLALFDKLICRKLNKGK